MIVLWCTLHEMRSQTTGIITTMVWRAIVGCMMATSYRLIGLHAEVPVSMMVMRQHRYHQHQDANAEQQEGDGAFLFHANGFCLQRYYFKILSPKEPFLFSASSPT